jgi:hypothetical protein
LEKGKVESAIGHTQATPLKGLRFESLEAAQTYLDRWEARWADTRIHGTTKRQVAAMFAEERPVLRPLPVEPFRYYRYGTRIVHLDGCVEVDRATTPRRPAGSAAPSPSSGTAARSACSIRPRGSCSSSTDPSAPAAMRRPRRISRPARRRPRWPSWPGPPAPAPASAPCARPSTGAMASPASAGPSGSSP